MAAVLTDDIFASDVLQPDQFAELYRSRHLSSEQRLMLEVLSDAIQCASNKPPYYVSADRRDFLRREALEWIHDKRAKGVFSFVGVCEGLGIDVAWLRKGIMRWCANRKRGRICEITACENWRPSGNTICARDRSSKWSRIRPPRASP